MQELRPGLWTWKAPHPDWSEKEEWGPDVRSYAYDTGASLVLFDPLAPPSLIEGLIEAQEVGVLLTAEWHRRSADECVERFGAHIYAATEDLPGGIEPRRTADEAEVAYWIPRHGAVVVGDSFTAEPELEVRTDWLPPGVTRMQMLDGLRPLRDLPVELILVTHGDPVVDDAHERLRALLDD